MKIITVDCKYVESDFAASYLLIERGRGLFIECNTNPAIPRLKDAAAREGLSPSDIEGLIITHVHLDHAGGAGLFLKTFPNATLLAHPRAARHAIDPSRLVDSATSVYGEAFMKERYGEILPCDPARVRSLADGERVSFQGIKLETRHTRGHANHHLVVFEPTSRTLFTGDSCGVSYPGVNRRRGVVALPSTSPTDFDGPAALETLDWIERLAPDRIAPTHFGMIEKKDHSRILKMLRDQLRGSIRLLERIRAESLSVDVVRGILREETLRYFSTAWQVEWDEADLKWIEMDLDVNSQGLVWAAQKQG